MPRYKVTFRNGKSVVVEAFNDKDARVQAIKYLRKKGSGTVEEPVSQVERERK